jgi:hypothetical protein
MLGTSFVLFSFVGATIEDDDFTSYSLLITHYSLLITHYKKC